MSKIVLEDFNEGNGYYKINLAYLNREQVEEIEKLVNKWDKRTDEIIKECIGMALTDVPETRFKSYNVSLKDCLAWLEKQGNNLIKWNKNIEGNKPQVNHSVLIKTTHGITEGEWKGEHWYQYRWSSSVNDSDVLSWMELSDLEKQGEEKSIFNANNWYVSKVDGKIHNIYNSRVAPKFKVGDYIKHNKANIICKIISVNTGSYYVENIETGGRIELFNAEQNFHLWTIQDAKAGDVLYSLDSKQPFIFKHRKTNEQANVYCGINIYGKFFVGNTKDCIITTDKYIPATKEQRDLLFQKMQEAGYEWDSKKKELRKKASTKTKVD